LNIPIFLCYFCNNKLIYKLKLKTMGLEKEVAQTGSTLLKWGIGLAGVFVIAAVAYSGWNWSQKRAIKKGEAA
jgi:hypothetical protein